MTRGEAIRVRCDEADIDIVGRGGGQVTGHGWTAPGHSGGECFQVKRYIQGDLLGMVGHCIELAGMGPRSHLLSPVQGLGVTYPFIRSPVRRHSAGVPSRCRNHKDGGQRVGVALAVGSHYLPPRCQEVSKSAVSYSHS